MLQFPEPCDTGKDHRAWLLCVFLTPFYAFVTRLCWPVDWVWQCSFLSRLMEEFVQKWRYFPLFDFSFQRTNLAINSSSQAMANIASFPVTKAHLHDTLTHVLLPDTVNHVPPRYTFSELIQLRDKPLKAPLSVCPGPGGYTLPWHALLLLFTLNVTSLRVTAAVSSSHSALKYPAHCSKEKGSLV